jgi:hypothetical protein
MPDKYVEEQKAEAEESPWDDEDNDEDLRMKQKQNNSSLAKNITSNNNPSSR